MIKKIKIFTVLAVLTVFSSCNDWLEVTPQGDAKADDLLTSTVGYNSALAGVYYNLVDESLFSGDMSFGALDVMAQYHEVNSTHIDYKYSQFDYSDTSVKSKIDNWWKSLYVTIAQINQILESLENNNEDIDTPELFKGELLGLRAFCHLQLYNLFGPVVQSEADLAQKAIPYRTKYDNVATPFLTCREVLTNVKKDLSEALILLDKDPIKDAHKFADNNISKLDYNNILNNRASHLNYFAVMGLLMRTEQLMLNQSKEDGAFYWANRILEEIQDNSSIKLAGTDAASGRDNLFTTEIISYLQRDDLYVLAQEKLVSSWGESSNALLFDLQAYENLTYFVYGRTPDGGGTDYRLNFWLKLHPGIPNTYGFYKYDFLTYYKSLDGYSFSPSVAILRLSEVYYALCEAMIGVDNEKAIDYLDDIRERRGLPRLGHENAENVEIYLMRERRKEFIGEGRTFFINKRLFKNIEASSSRTIAASKAIFELPIPEDEYEYGPETK